mgnify:CR=1 FL=1
MELKDAEIGQVLYTNDTPFSHSQNWVIVEKVEGIFGLDAKLVEVDEKLELIEDPDITTISNITPEDARGVGGFRVAVEGLNMNSKGINFMISLRNAYEEKLAKI